MDVGPAIRPAPPFCTKSARFCRANIVEKPQKTRKRHARRQGKPGGSAARRAGEAGEATSGAPAAGGSRRSHQRRTSRRRKPEKPPAAHQPPEEAEEATSGAPAAGGSRRSAAASNDCHADKEKQRHGKEAGKPRAATPRAPAAKTRFYYMRAPKGTKKKQNSHF